VDNRISQVPARGLHFPNAFPRVPDLEIDLPGGITVPIGDAAGGLGGGMAWMVRDLFEAGLAPPAGPATPGDLHANHQVLPSVGCRAPWPTGPGHGDTLAG
jgi:hypothetical protein